MLIFFKSSNCRRTLFYGELVVVEASCYGIMTLSVALKHNNKNSDILDIIKLKLQFILQNLIIFI